MECMIFSSCIRKDDASSNTFEFFVEAVSIEVTSVISVSIEAGVNASFSVPVTLQEFNKLLVCLFPLKLRVLNFICPLFQRFLASFLFPIL